MVTMQSTMSKNPVQSNSQPALASVFGGGQDASSQQQPFQQQQQQQQ
eukprot:CAMPEP_0206624660 /NCGR_PEP_ID=MMETSP0325_2-20121206/64279_1 /ASSEMBLY_ACC=CAM_ASM_000347 /TAXON_ID=2866 /ORGANISM="Crypthecodinium cohnii, Strain Seligo" /LENGTH=46 /DNA_ID= /DNA_START= /DNA_END= /DNA_ORIENTATION=